MKKELALALLVSVLGMQGCGGKSEEQRLPVAKQSAGPFYTTKMAYDQFGELRETMFYDMFTDSDLKCSLDSAEIAWSETGRDYSAVVVGYDRCEAKNNGLVFSFKGLDPFSIGGTTQMFSYRMAKFVLEAGYDFSYYRYSWEDRSGKWSTQHGIINDTEVYDYQNKKTGDEFYYSFVG